MAGKIVDVTLRLIDKLSGPLNTVGDNLSKCSRQWINAGKQIQNAGKTISNVGGSLTKTVTVPIAAAGAASVKLAADFEKGMSTVKSISGATGKDLEELTKKAKEMGLKTKYSATESTEAFKYMAMAGWKSKEMIDGIEGVMYLAGATGEDLAGVSDIVTDSLTAFGLSAKDTNSFVDILAQTANKSNTNISMLGESFKYVAPVAGALKFNAQDISTALGLMANSGIKASSAGTALRSFMTKMAKPTKESQAAMEALGISLTDSKGNMKSFGQIMTETRKSFSGLTDSQKAQYAAALAGKTGMSGLLAIVNAADDDFNNLSQAIYDSNGACKKIYDTANDNLTGQLTILKSTVESVGLSFGEKLLPYVKQATQFIQNLAEKFNTLTPAQQDTIIKIGLLAATIGPALLVFGKTVSVIGKVVRAVGMVGKAFKIFGSLASIITSPVGIVIAVLAAIVVAGVLIYKNWDKIKATATKLWNYVKNIFSSMGISGEGLKKKLAPIGEKFSAIGKHIQELWDIASPVLSVIGETIKTVFVVYIGAAIGAAIGYFSSLFDSITQIIDGILTSFDGLITFITGVFTGDWEKAWSGVKSIFTGIFETLGGILKIPINGVISLINGAIAGINNLNITIPDWVPVLGGKKYGLDIPKIPMLSRGTDNWIGGIVQISEKGGEIVDLPSGSRVYPHDETVRKAYADGARNSGGRSVYIAKIADSIVVRNDEDIDRIAEALAKKLFETSDNMGGGEVGYIY